MTTRSRATSLATLFTFCCLCSCSSSKGPSSSNDPGWIGAWSASPSQPESTLTFDNQTVRQIVRVSVPGRQVRITLSNLYGTESLEIGDAHIALSASGASELPSSDRVITFAGSASCTIAPGASVRSDAVDMNVSGGSKLVVSLYLPGQLPQYDSGDHLHPNDAGYAAMAGAVNTALF